MTRTFMAVMFAMGLFLTGTQAKAAFTLSYAVVNQTVPPLGTDLMTIFCPTGTRVVSGGWDTTAAQGQYLMVWVSRQINNTWRIMTKNTHPTAYLGINGYAVCASGVSGLSTNSASASVNVPAFSTRQGSAFCTGPDFVTGGGFDSNFPNPLQLNPVWSSPLSGIPNQWFVSEYNGTSQAKSFIVLATCLRGLNASVSSRRGDAVIVPLQSSATSSVECDQGDFAVGGGFSIVPTNPNPTPLSYPKMRIFGNLPTTTNPRRWTVKAFNTDGFEHGVSVTPYANCLHLN